MTRSRTGSRRPKATTSADWRAEDPNLALESLRYAEPIPSRELLLKHLAEAQAPLTVARLARRLGLDRAEQRDALAKRLAAMVRDGQALESPAGFVPAGEGERVVGRVRGRPNGDVLVMPEDGSAPLALARSDAASLMQNDRIEVRAVGMNDRGRRIARLIRRSADAPARIGGIYVAGYGRGRLEPEDPGHWYPIEVRTPGPEVRDGDAVIVEITRRPQGPAAAAGHIVEVLRDLKPAELAARFAILRHDLPQEFPPEVLAEANRYAPQVSAADREGREDLRDLPLVTIDGADARDFDDAVHAEPLRGGGWRLVVAIADVSHYVRPGTALDREARDRATSVYFPDRVLPMLPEHLSNHLCSLMPRVERLAFVCDVRIGKSGKPGRARFYEAVIRSHARLTYDQAWRFLENPRAANDDPDLTPAVRSSLETLYRVYEALRGAREARGALDFRGGEVKARIGDDGRIEGFDAIARNDAHRLIEECMIAANVEAAAALRLAKVGSLYRVHGQPEEKRVAELTKIMNALEIGAQFSEEPSPREFAQLIERLGGRRDSALLETLVIRALAQAVYQQTNIGHFGLALKEYAHFTSPIRRYPDLLVHRAIKAALVPGSRWGHRYAPRELEAMGMESSQRERRADEASRDVLGYLKCLYMQPRIGEEFDATITSALEFGLFVQLARTSIDGLVHISTIPGDYWELDRSGLGLIGRSTRRRFRMGDAVRVRLTRVDLTQRQIDFELVEPAGAPSHPAKRASVHHPARQRARGPHGRGGRARRGGR